jgi:cation transport regulator ChaC
MRVSVHTGGMVRVFGYGSNMRAEQLRARCPSATDFAPAWLPGHRLLFVGHSGAWGGSVATVEPRRNGMVGGVIASITCDDLSQLDVFEGAPIVYRRLWLPVRLGLPTGRRVNAWVYVHTGAEAGGPSYRYLAALVAGAAEHGLPWEPIVEAAERCLRAELARKE